MKSTVQKGFTLIEVLIVVGIVMLIFSLGLMVSMDFYRQYTFSTERGVIVSTLQKARNQSMNNVNQVRHGVHVTTSPSLQYILFECVGNPQCTSYTASSADIIIGGSAAATMTSPGSPTFDVIFNQLDGSCVTSNCVSSPLTITLTQGAKSFSVSVNSEGRISW